MSECLQIEVVVFESRRYSDDRVVAVDARTNISIPLNGCYSVPRLERLKKKIDRILHDDLPDCLI